jgi:hypothetical protein
VDTTTKVALRLAGFRPRERLHGFDWVRGEGSEIMCIQVEGERFQMWGAVGNLAKVVEGLKG